MRGHWLYNNPHYTTDKRRETIMFVIDITGVLRFECFLSESNGGMKEIVETMNTL